MQGRQTLCSEEVTFRLMTKDERIQSGKQWKKGAQGGGAHTRKGLEVGKNPVVLAE